MLAAWNDIAIEIADQSLQHTPAPELLLRVESEFMTPDTNELARMNEYSDLWLQFMSYAHGGLRSAGAYETTGESDGGL